MELDKDNQQFKNVLDLIQFTNHSIFITGKAGTGKSTLLKYICQECKKEKVVLAPTGIAAINVGGATLHSFFKLPFQPLTPDNPNYNTPQRLRAFLKYGRQQLKLLKKLEMVIIDEISMVRADIIDFIDKILRVFSGNMRTPFGGKQMIFVGDVFQLEPVVTRDERDIIARFYKAPYFFEANVFKEMALVSVELIKAYRQKDKAFISILDHIRMSNLSDADLQLLNMRVEEHESQGEVEELENDFTVTLATRRDVVDYINHKRLNDIQMPSVVFKGKVTGDFPENSLPTSLELELKVGAQVIFIKNDPEKRWVNGTIGVVESIGDNGKSVNVLTDDGDYYDVTKVVWENVRYHYNEKEKKIEEEELGTFTQLPVKLAWAITIHKSQGLTFQKVNVDLTGGTFAGGQAYVALSRCTSLDGLSLKHPLTRSDVFVNPNVVRFAKTFNDNMAMQAALKTAGADIEYRDAVKAFDNGDMQAALDHFFKAIHLRYDIEKPLMRRFARRKLEVVNEKDRTISALKSRIEALHKDIQQKNKQLDELAGEYVQMAYECITLDSLQPAMANVEKALKLSPLNIEAIICKTRVLLLQRQLRKALTTINKAVDYAPKAFKPLFWKANVLFNMNKLEEAVALLDRCTSIRPKNADAHQLLADVLTAAGDDENAAIHYAIAEQLRKLKKTDDE